MVKDSVKGTQSKSYDALKLVLSALFTILFNMIGLNALKLICFLSKRILKANRFALHFIPAKNF